MVSIAYTDGVYRVFETDGTSTTHALLTDALKRASDLFTDGEGPRGFVWTLMRTMEHARRGTL